MHAPQGFHASGDGYTKWTDNITEHVPNLKKCIDDSCLYSDTIETSFWQTVEYIDLCARNGMVFNPDKFAFGKDIVEFAGFEVTADGYRPTKKILGAIRNFPVPTDLTGIRSWFGLVQQVAYAFSKTEVMAPFRKLQQKNSKFYWDSFLEDLFLMSREKIAKLVEEGVKAFELNCETMLSVDWSEEGIGYFLQQKHC